MSLSVKIEKKTLEKIMCEKMLATTFFFFSIFLGDSYQWHIVSYIIKIQGCLIIRKSCIVKGHGSSFFDRIYWNRTSKNIWPFSYF